ncbi:MAG: hypothetical protein ACOZBH_03980 [Patescibacteria group bacterium]
MSKLLFFIAFVAITITAMISLDYAFLETTRVDTSLLKMIYSVFSGLIGFVAGGFIFGSR